MMNISHLTHLVTKITLICKPCIIVYEYIYNQSELMYLNLDDSLQYLYSWKIDGANVLVGIYIYI